MDDHGEDRAFVGSVPDLYDELLVPMIFAEAADDLARQIAGLGPTDLLETAAGTGVLTRAVGERCPDADIVATDLNEPMLAVAAARGPAEGPNDVPATRTVRWQPANAQDLPFADASFDVVACQFGVMFFPDRPRAFREAHRVLRPGGTLAFNTWDSLDTNDFARVVHDTVVAATPDDPLPFIGRTPHGLHDEVLLRAELTAAGFDTVTCEWREAVSRSTAAEAALAYCQGTPLRGMLDAHPALDAETATALAADALLAAFGPGLIEGRIRWLRILAS